MSHMSSMNVSLPESLREWVDKRVETRGYGTVSEYVRDLIRRDQIEAEREAIDEKLIKALNSEFVEVTDEDWAELHRELDRRIARRIGKQAG